LDLVPLLHLTTADGRGEDREVGRWAIRVDMGEAAADPWRAGTVRGNPAGLGNGPAGGLHHRRVEALEALPGDRGLEGVREHATGEEGVSQVRREEERRAPALDRSAVRVVSLAGGRAGSAAVGASDLQRDLNRPLDRVVGGLEADDQQVCLAA